MDNPVGQLCGRDFKVIKPTILHARDKKKAYNRVVVEGVNHPKGLPIRFKSHDRAERHMLNMHLTRD